MSESTSELPLPVLLPQKRQRSPSRYEWTPRKDLTIPYPPTADESRTQDQEMAAARQLMDGKPVKKVRPRRTVDYGGSMGRWNMVSLLG